VICATDFSIESDRAADAAALLGRQYDSQIVAVHVAARPADSLAAHERLERWARPRLGGTVTVTVVCVGRPAREIARLARARDADLVLIGRHRAADPLVPMGLETELVEQARCPVFAVASLAEAQLLAARFEPSDDVTCLVCGRSLGERVCSGCRAVINWEAMEHKWGEILREGPGLMGLGGARASGPVGRSLDREGHVEPPAPVAAPPPPRRHWWSRFTRS
jgi:nucleotide-binding universal stress UspA family protein